MPSVTFYFDVGSPYACLTAERLDSRWPDPWPTDYLLAMRAVTFAFREGRGRELTLTAFRNAFQKGSDLSIAANVFHAAAQVGLERSELERAVRDPDVKDELRRATDVAFEVGVLGVPTFAIDGELFWGDDRLEDAALHLARRAAA